MNRRFLVGVLVLVAILGAASAHLTYTNWYVIDTFETEIFFRVTDQNEVGFSADTDRLHFGRILHGGSAGRDVILSSKVDAYVYFGVDPELEEWFIANPNPAYLGAGETLHKELFMSIPEDTLPGNYSGVLTTTYVRKLPWN